MKMRMLAVRLHRTNYLHVYEVDYACSLEEAKEKISSAERSGKPYETLDLPVANEKKFWDFVEWMEETGRNYRFSIYGAKSDAHFWSIAEKVREKGFHFNS